MSAQEVFDEIITPMQRLFLPPKAMPDQQAQEALREYVDALKGHNAVVLRGAWQTVRDNHEGRSWPSIGAFVKAARSASHDVHSSTGRKSARDERQAILWNRWLGVRGSGLARQACQMGVAWALKCAVLNDGIGPDKVDLKALLHAKQRAEHTADKIRRGESHEWKGRNFVFGNVEASLALRMWRNLIQKEAETQEELGAGNVPREAINSQRYSQLPRPAA